MPDAPRTAPPPFLALAGHPLRWELLSQLARSDRRVSELCALTDRPQNLVSYHLRALRDGGLVTARRSSADGRDTYYTADLERCRSALRTAAVALHPALGPAGRRRPPVARVLFTCTGNSARSQMAEALCAQRGAGVVVAASAGSHPKDLHPAAVRAMAHLGIDISGWQPKHFDRVADQRFDQVISLCDRVREICPEFPGDPRQIHWSIPDPSRADGDVDAAFGRVRDELQVRIDHFIAGLTASTEQEGILDV